MVKQFFMFSFVGISTNLLGYAGYLFLTGMALTPKISMTIVYLLLTMFSYLGNSYFTFKSIKEKKNAFIKYVFIYVIGYIFNFLILMFFVDILSIDHKIVQFFSIFTVAILMFVVSKFWVFKERQV